MKKNFLICFLLLFCFLLYAEASLKNKNNKYYTFLQNVVNDYHVPGLTVSIFTDKGIGFNAAYGSLKSGKPITVDTQFFLGSTTKTLTALGIMILADEDKLNILDPVKKYLPQFSLRDDTISPGGEEKITLEHLLNHTSGISDRTIPGPNMGKISIENELLRVNKATLASIPGSYYKYCNLNYRLLGLIIERISGMDFGSFIKKKIFIPLSMNHSFYKPIEANELAEGYGQLLGFPIMRKQTYYPGALPSGYLISSVSDISLLLMDELRANQGEKSILPQHLVESTWEIPVNIESNYAKGWIHRKQDNGTYFLFHGGSLENYQSFFYLDPINKIGFVFMMNQGGLFPATGAYNAIRNGLINLINNKANDYSRVNKFFVISIILILIILLIQCILFFRLGSWKRNLPNKKMWKKFVSIGFNLFWIIFFLFLFVPIMNIIMGDTASLEMILNILPEMFYTIIIIVISNIIRAGLKIKYIMQLKIITTLNHK